jgi:glycosyltransferase involved in cell wall biosynthesis
MADRITAVSHGVKQDLVRTLGLAPERIQVIYNPIVDDRLREFAREPLTHPWFESQKPVVLGTGRLVPQKDFRLLLRAFAQVRRSRAARLVILGEGPMRKSLLELADELGIAKDVWLPGFDPNPFKYMARCSVFILSSLHEGLPGVLIQAMACGAAVISTDCEFGPAEIITRPGVDGYLTPVGDLEALTERLAYLLDHPDVREDMGQHARQSAERFSVASAVEQYQALLTSTAPPPTHKVWQHSQSVS